VSGSISDAPKESLEHRKYVDFGWTHCVYDSSDVVIALGVFEGRRPVVGCVT
jgi:hypothetical protein